MHPSEPARGPHVLRQINIAAVLRAVREHSPARLAELMRVTGLSRPAVTRAVADLREAGLVADVEEPALVGLGRPAQRVRFRAEVGHVVGVDVGEHKILAKVADVAGTVLASHQLVITELATGDGLLDTLRAAIAGALEAAGLAPADVWAISVGAPGIVDAGTGEVLLAPSIPGWAHQPVLAQLRVQYGCPVLMDNDTNLAVQAERWCGAAAGSDSLVFVHWGARVGVGIIIDGRTYRGATAAAGELGFVDVFSPAEAGDPRVAVDASTELGPFERMVGARAILRLARQGGAGSAVEPTGSDALPALFASAAAGDPDALAVIDRMAARFARGLAVLLLILDPKEVIIGGGVSGGGDTLLAAIERHLRPRVLTWPRVALSGLGGDAVVLGAVRHALDHVEDRLLAQGP